MKVDDDRGNSISAKWIFTSYFSMGFIGSILTTASIILFKNIGLENSIAAGLSSLFLLAYMCKPIFTPLLHVFYERKNALLLLQINIFILIFIVGVCLLSKTAIWYVFLIMFFVSILGSAQDAMVDGKYVTKLSFYDQAKYCGLQSFSWNMGSILVAGGLISFSGYFNENVHWKGGVVFFLGNRFLSSSIYFFNDDLLQLDFISKKK